MQISSRDFNNRSKQSKYDNSIEGQQNDKKNNSLFNEDPADMADRNSIGKPELTSKTKMDQAKSGRHGIENNSNSGINSG